MRKNKHYSSKSQILNPGQLISDIFSDLKSSQFLAWRLLNRDIAAKYRQTATGYWLAILPPIVTAIIFIILNKSAILNVGETGIPYPAFVITGTILWTLFIDSINAPINELQTNKAMLVRVSFAKEALIFTSFGQVFFNFVIKLAVLIAVLLIFKIRYSPNWFLIIIPVLSTATLGIFCGLFFAPFTFLYHDLRQFVVMMFAALMYFAPVAYPLPESGILHIIGKFNPMTYILNLFRDVLFKETYNDMGITVGILIISILFLFVSLVIFRIAIPYLVERMDA